MHPQTLRRRGIAMMLPVFLLSVYMFVYAEELCAHMIAIRYYTITKNNRRKNARSYRDCGYECMQLYINTEMCFPETNIYVQMRAFVRVCSNVLLANSLNAKAPSAGWRCTTTIGTTHINSANILCCTKTFTWHDVRKLKQFIHSKNHSTIGIIFAIAIYV